MRESDVDVARVNLIVNQSVVTPTDTRIHFMKKPLALLAVVAVLAGCSTTSPDVIQRGDAQRLSQVQDATVLSVRAVTVDGSQSGGGGVTGAVVGGVAGSQVGGNKVGLAREGSPLLGLLAS